MKTIRQCPQLIIYVVLSVVSAIFTYVLSFDTFKKLPHNFKSIMIITNILVFMGMSLLYFWLCSIGYKTTAWVILLVPIVCSFLFGLFVNGAAAPQLELDYEQGQGKKDKPNMQGPMEDQ